MRPPVTRWVGATVIAWARPGKASRGFGISSLCLGTDHIILYLRILSLIALLYSFDMG
jgi:hypothetical protein